MVSETPPALSKPATRSLAAARPGVWRRLLPVLPVLPALLIAGTGRALASGQASALTAGQVLDLGQDLESANNQYALRMQADGNLVLYASGRALWDTRTVVGPGGDAEMQTDGNLVVYDSHRRPLWASNTAGHPGSYVTAQDDGDLVLRGPDSVPLWASGTADSVLVGGQVLTSGQYLGTLTRQYRLRMQGDGNFVLYAGGHPAWAANTAVGSGGDVEMQTDGNLVVYDAARRPVWASNTWGHPGARLTLGADGDLVVADLNGVALWTSGTFDAVLLGGESLYPGQYLEAPTRRHSLLMQGDGNLVLYADGQPRWASATAASPGGHAEMQTDGNLVIYNSAHAAVWASNTWGNPGAYLMVEGDGTIMIFGSDGTKLWARVAGGWDIQLWAPLIRQARNLDCESAALRIALASRGTSVSENWILAQIGADTRHALMSGGNVVRWGNPWTTFVGNVDGAEWDGSGYGVYFPPIVAAAERAGHRATGGRGWSGADVFNQLALGHPVVIWTMQTFQPAAMRYYTSWDGQVIPWRVGEHAVTVTGVNSQAGTVTLVDPLDGRMKTFSIAQFLSFWSSFGNMAVAVD